MTESGAVREFGVAAFRMKLLAALSLLIISLTIFGLYLAERQVTAETQHDLRQAFDAELALLRTAREFRHASVIERCHALVHKPRIHAALEDGALDLLYPNAASELGKVLVPGNEEEPLARRSTRARFYRFLNAKGALIPPVVAAEVGELAAEDEQKLSFKSLPEEQQSGYFWMDGNREVVEVIVTPIISTEDGQAIAALVAGFPVAGGERLAPEIQSGLWLDGRLYFQALAEPLRAGLNAKVTEAVTSGEDAAKGGVEVQLGGGRFMLFCESLNPNGLFQTAHEVAIYSLADLLSRQRDLRWRAGGAGALLLLLGIGASFYVSARLAAPVRELAAVSAENRVLREKAEAALKVKSDELLRTARFSADASHQLKTPVAVLRAGLGELIAYGGQTPEAREEISMLLQQTSRLTSIIEDLLLLSRLDAGRVQLEVETVNLTGLVESCVEDLEVLHGFPADCVETNIPPSLMIDGQKRYTHIVVHNLIENARKYNCPGGRIRITAYEEGSTVFLRIANNGHSIPESSREHIFERFHRGGMNENVPGHGLGLNLARELARIHGGDLRLVRSDGEWTEFEARFHSAKVDAKNAEA